MTLESASLITAESLREFAESPKLHNFLSLFDGVTVDATLSKKDSAAIRAAHDHLE